MNIYILIITTLILSCCSTKKENDALKAKEISELFQIVENDMQAHYDYLDKNKIFEDPLGRIWYFFKTVNTIAPQLLTDTKLYKTEVFNILTDTSFQKNQFTNNDIVYILYNLPVDDYVDLLSSVTSLYKKKKITRNIFESFIFQDFNVSNSIAKNFTNEKLQVFLNNILNDQEIYTNTELQNKRFKKNILELKKGTLWEGEEDVLGLKEMGEIQPPILDSIKFHLQR